MWRGRKINAPIPVWVGAHIYWWSARSGASRARRLDFLARLVGRIADRRRWRRGRRPSHQLMAHRHRRSCGAHRRQHHRNNCDSLDHHALQALSPTQKNHAFFSTDSTLVGLIPYDHYTSILKTIPAYMVLAFPWPWSSAIAWRFTRHLAARVAFRAATHRVIQSKRMVISIRKYISIYLGIYRRIIMSFIRYFCRIILCRLSTGYDCGAGCR